MQEASILPYGASLSEADHSDCDQIAELCALLDSMLPDNKGSHGDRTDAELPHPASELRQEKQAQLQGRKVSIFGMIGQQLPCCMAMALATIWDPIQQSMRQL